MNLDGGASSALWLGGKVVTKPGRKLSNIIAVVRVKDWSKFDQSHAQKQSAPNIEKAHAWARDWINNAYEKGFVPDFLLDDYQQSITRGEFVKLAMGWLRCHLGKTDDQILAEKGLARLSFADTGDPVICAAAALGITSGVGGGSFGASDKFTREQAAAMVVSVLRITGFNTTNLQDAGFADLGAASDWARGTINIVGSSGIMAGVGESRFDPKATFSREQSIIVFGKMPN